MPNVGRDTPHVTWGTQKDYRKVYFSTQDAELKLPITVRKGYGVLEMGTAMAIDTSNGGAHKGKYFPYDPSATITGAETAPGRAYVVATPSGTKPLRREAPFFALEKS